MNRNRGSKHKHKHNDKISILDTKDFANKSFDCPIRVVLVETNTVNVTAYMGTGTNSYKISSEGIQLNLEQAEALFGYQIKNYRS